jgi:hypothetical protein
MDHCAIRRNARARVSLLFILIFEKKYFSYIEERGDVMPIILTFSPLNE